MTCSRVDFPEPDGPVIATSAPGVTSRSTWSSAGRDQEYGANQDEPNHCCQYRCGSDRERRSCEDCREPEANCAAGDRADDADYHPLSEREPKESHRAPSSGREHRLFADSIAKIHRQDIRDAECAEQ